jgi:hypothetical protein
VHPYIAIKRWVRVGIEVERVKFKKVGAGGIGFRDTLHGMSDDQMARCGQTAIEVYLCPNGYNLSPRGRHEATVLDRIQQEGLDGDAG